MASTLQFDQVINTSTINTVGDIIDQETVILQREIVLGKPLSLKDPYQLPSAKEYQSLQAPQGFSDIDDVDTFVKFKLQEYEEHNFQDDKLWELFKEDFNSFTEQIFKSCNQTWT
ncbi:MAG: hypothetical protein FRX48_06919 [Lasallia pustulata]|uniref:Uncharacterized protein n=1 Tax=Lasallia pustulata TaxID=136370 RepID=A0A5M8PKM3_9LECA|nr:MAG: hypothetical protein FRX48_06919 [Lasallia pustulata]